MLLMIDNYDSFTYNLVQYLGELGSPVTVYRNDRIAVADIAEMAPIAENKVAAAIIKLRPHGPHESRLRTAAAPPPPTLGKYDGPVPSADAEREVGWWPRRHVRRHVHQSGRSQSCSGYVDYHRTGGDGGDHALPRVP